MDFVQLKKLLEIKLSSRFSKQVHVAALDPVEGGSISNCLRVRLHEGQQFFLKINEASYYPGLFDKEKQGLEFLAAQNIIQTPEIIFSETSGENQLLLLEWVRPGLRNDDFWKLFGEQLAQLHSVTNDRFGFTDDNYMGALPQVNRPTASWIEFFIDCRLRPQVALGRSNNFLAKPDIDAFDSLFKKLNSFFEKEKPSLLHGDLWHGNLMCNDQSRPVLIDPAVYFGHRSMDMGMTTLFGGFDQVFYDAYQHHFPQPGNYHEQWAICNLYPLLIHLNIFGAGYLHNIKSILRSYA